MKLKVRVIPNARKTGFDGQRADEWLLRLSAPASDGKANAAAIDYIARCMGVSRSSITLLAGEKSRHKIFEIVGLANSDVERRLSERGG